MSGIMAMLMNNVAPRGDRTVYPFSKNVLIVYDLNSVIANRYDFDPNPASLAATIASRETSLGFTPTTITSYASFVSADISKYAHIWDLGYDTLMTTAAADKYKTYLQGGGAAFLLGENGFLWTEVTQLIILSTVMLEVDHVTLEPLTNRKNHR